MNPWSLYAALLLLDVCTEASVAAAVAPQAMRRSRARFAAAAALLTHGLGTIACVHGALDPVSCEALGAAIDYVLWRTLGGANAGTAARLAVWTNLAAAVAAFAFLMLAVRE